MTYTLLTNKTFFDDLQQEIAKAKRRIYIQFMTFEGDKTGLRLAEALIKAKKKVPDIRVLIDRYTDEYVSRKHRKNPQVWKEVQETKKMLATMAEAGIRINRTRPYGFLRLLFGIRNHKKIIVIDNKSYLGGLNISDHNKEWNDFMIKIKDKTTTNSITEDFKHGWKGHDRPYHHNNIYTNKYLEYKYQDLIKNAKKEIIISSPYVLDRTLLKNFRHKPIRRIVLTSKEGNWGILNYLAKYLVKELDKMGVNIYHYKKFSHAKFLCVDREKLLVGSSNFGQENFSALDEIGIVISDKKFIKTFLSKMHPNAKQHEKYLPRKGIYFFSWMLSIIIQWLLKGYVKFFKKWSKPLG